MPPQGVALMARRGYDLDGHVSTQVNSGLVEDADVLLGMSQRHVRSLVASWPNAWPRTFTIADFVARAELDGPAAAEHGSRAWVETLSRTRDRVDVLGSSADDVLDPMGRSERVWDAVADTLAELSGRLAQAGSTPALTDPTPARGRHRRP